MSTSTSRPTPADVLQTRMQTLKLTLRDIVNAGKKFSDADPGRFHELKKALVWSLLQPGYITPYKPSAAIVNTLIMVLWDGDWRAFDRDMNFGVQHTLRTNHDDIHQPSRQVEHYLEGEIPAKQRNRSVTPELPNTHFLYTPRSDDLAPRVPAGTTTECQRLNRDELASQRYVDHAIILQDKRGVLTAAWQLGDRSFQRHGVPFTLPSDTRVFGVITWVTPTLNPKPSPTLAARPTTTTPSTSGVSRSASTPLMRTVTIPAPRDLQIAIASAALDAGIPIRQYVEEAIHELITTANRDLDSIPADAHLERVREDAGNPIMSHLVDAEVHRDLKQLTQDLTGHRGRRFYMNELVIYALREKLTHR